MYAVDPNKQNTLLAGVGLRFDETTLDDSLDGLCDNPPVDHLAKDTRELMEALHFRVEAAYQSSIVIAILFRRLLPFLE